MIKNYFLVLISLIFLMGYTLSPANAQSNQYLHFDRIDDYCTLPAGSQYIANSSQFSMAGWFYTDQFNYGQGMMSFRSAGQGFYLIQLANGIIECRFQNSSGTLYEYVAPAYTIVPGVWQHYAWVYNGSSVILYQNGVQLGQVNASGMITDSNIEFTIGKCLLGSFNFVFGGRADEVTVWNKALTATEIQDMMANELLGTETGLQLYYKFNQGSPGGNNTSINKLLCELGSGTRDMDLLNFAMTGETSNFNGTLNLGYQAISFDAIPNKLISDPAFTAHATATSGLPVQFEIVSGPATIVDSTITLSGQAGQVIVKASQPGDVVYQAAIDVLNSFMVLDPATFVPEIDNRSPLSGTVYNPGLDAVQLATYVNIDYPELFSVGDVFFIAENETIPATNWQNGYYTAWWTPSDFGAFTVITVAKNNFGADQILNTPVTVVQNTNNQTLTAFTDIWIDTNNPSETAFAELPSYTGAFNQINATLKVNCPPGGCGEWDRVGSIDARGANGQWIEIIRYITPYGVACTHDVDLSAYMSILQGKVEFRVNCGTLDNGYLYELELQYNAGTPAHKFSYVEPIWWETFPFGDYANLQPVPQVNHSFAEEAVDAKLVMMTTGHGWGDLNTSNAAEFYEATHKINVNGDEIPQHLWVTCNPNPDGCQPQNGTWYYNRAGWCPGSIAEVYTYELGYYLNQSGQVSLNYQFFDGYVDLCHPNHPNCVSGVTCTDCNDTYNPHLIVAANLVTYYDSAFVVDPLNIEKPDLASRITAFPNPGNGLFILSSDLGMNQAKVSIFGLDGRLIQINQWSGSEILIDLTNAPSGVYQLVIEENKTQVKKRIVKL